MLAKVDFFQEEIRINREKTGASLKEMKAEIRANNKMFEALRAKTDANNEELMAAMKASQERIDALMDVSLEAMVACLEKAKEQTSGNEVCSGA
jgi:hypothetical protein